MQALPPPPHPMWRRITDDYWVSETGKLWSTVTGRVLSTKVSKVGYETINLKRLGTRSVHILVAEAWVGQKPSDEHVIDHIDGNKLNNNASNLEWVTRKNNTTRAVAMGLVDVKRSRALTPSQVYRARASRREGKSLSVIAADAGVSHVTIRSAVHGLPPYADLTDVPPVPLPREPGTWRPGAGGKRHEGPRPPVDGHPNDFIESLPNEVWVRLREPISGYWISDQGRVFSAKSRKLKKSVVNTKQQSYLRIQLRSDNGGHESFMLHRLVAEYFLPPPSDPAFIVGHLNENPQDPRASNLAWISRRENAQRAHVAKTRNPEVIDLQNFLSAHVAVERLVRIEGVVLDAFVPERKTGIILDDVRQTSELSGVNRSARVQAMRSLEKAGVRLIRVFSNEWLTKRELVNSMLLNKLGKTATKIMARSTTVQEVTVQEASAFLNQNHLQGTIGSRVKLGCYHNGRLVALATFGQQRYGESPDCFELLRFANLSQHYVVGGFSKILSHFKRNYQAKKLLSFADRRWSSGGMYENSGFTLTRVSAPNYFYFRAEEPNTLYSRVRFQKHKLEKLLEKFDPEKSEVENVLANGWDRIWDCGNLVYEMEMQ
jgi:hypothetical protein